MKSYLIGLCLLTSVSSLFAQDIVERTIVNIKTKEVISMKCVNEECTKVRFYMGKPEEKMRSLTKVLDVNEIRSGKLEQFTIKLSNTNTADFIRQLDEVPELFKKGPYQTNLGHALEVAGLSVAVPIGVVFFWLSECRFGCYSCADCFGRRWC